MTITELKNLLKYYHLSPNKTYGQNFLLNEVVLEDALDAAQVKPGDNVLEIGPGIGNLTTRLLSRGASVLAVEKDKNFMLVLKRLKKSFPQTLRYEIADSLKFNFQQFFEGKPYKVVANIPYYITGKIIYLLLQAKHKPSSVTILVQKEVAQNIVAKAGQLNILAISVQLYGDAKIIGIVPARDFYPSPKVDSALLHIKVSAKPRFRIADEKEFFRIIKSCFAGKRKQLHNTLVNNLRLNKDEAARVLKKLNINPMARPQELSIEQWVELAEEIPGIR